MQQIFNFILKNSNKLLFLLLLGISLSLTIQSHSYHRSRYISSANAFTGFVYEKINNVKEYLNLREQNNQLAFENAELKKLLYNGVDSLGTNVSMPKPSGLENIKVYNAKVINNTFNSKENYLTLLGGEKDGLKADMGVVNSLGVVGIIEKTSSSYSTVQSVLNVKSQINAKIKKSNHFGSLIWNGRNVGFAQLIDVPRLASVRKGDTIVTGGRSEIFPENIPIGTIDKVYIDKATNYYTLNVRLFNDMTNLGHVYVIENLKRAEIQKLEEETKNE
ncbi:MULTISPECIES: rod shape-determining protein MreC [unclassified Flavobacterium]|uniref:rod shape-determining protein MreC n=1 Tax=unclassified Flavobacterium TaxID=196869 RepID=UPI00086A92D5|nr:MULTISPECIES: rod shape-determining protein MreC [unclassified Flavobacterium]MBN9283955.1 rod shape-determining protein MreC [Flavobacterium sp.]ODS82401.1 MAG: rod shape-determining protein MreC [Chryseobacterium sp. SCN 40-13]OJV73387.1 MAG: rod shape-determining protein MreC [Flavobacterium sp. 40-81]